MLDPIYSAGLMGGTSLAGSMLTGGSSSKDARRAREWQRYTARHAYKWTVDSLEEAGLNPMLAVSNGPSSGMTSPMPHRPDLGNALGSGVSSGLAYASTKADVELKKQETKARELELKATQGMYEYLTENPQLAQLFYTGKLSKAAGLSANVYAPLMSMNSGSAQSGMGRFWDRVMDWMIQGNLDAANRSTEELKKELQKQKKQKEQPKKSLAPAPSGYKYKRNRINLGPHNR